MFDMGEGCQSNVMIWVLEGPFQLLETIEKANTSSETSEGVIYLKTIKQENGHC